MTTWEIVSALVPILGCLDNACCQLNHNHNHNSKKFEYLVSGKHTNHDANLVGATVVCCSILYLLQHKYLAKPNLVKVGGLVDCCRIHGHVVCGFKPEEVCTFGYCEETSNRKCGCLGFQQQEVEWFGKCV